ncbi:MAG: hypothetical protein SVX43_12565 [Cyanobacteriota bacterium]|nr:hypothetical protein [Cyanobacteriota bacterium]
MKIENSRQWKYSSKHLLLILGLAVSFWEISNLMFCDREALAVPRERTQLHSETPSMERYQVLGDRNGKVTVRNPISGNIVRTFQMTEGVVIREKFLLDNGRTVGASQRDKAIFWDVQTGKEIRRIDQRVYGFSDDETIFFTYGSRGLLVHSYPEMTQTCQLSNGSAQEGDIGPAEFQFSPDNRFLAIPFLYGKPARDDDYPGITGLVMGGVPGFRQIYNLQKCEIIPLSTHTVSVGNVILPGDFSADSKFYEARQAISLWQGRAAKVTLRFNLETNEVEQVFERYFP